MVPSRQNSPSILSAAYASPELGRNSGHRRHNSARAGQSPSCAPPHDAKRTVRLQMSDECHNGQRLPVCMQWHVIEASKSDEKPETN